MESVEIRLMANCMQTALCGEWMAGYPIRASLAADKKAAVRLIQGFPLSARSAQIQFL